VTSDLLEVFGSWSNCRGKMPDSPLLRTPMKVAHRMYEKQNVHEKISGDLATLVSNHELQHANSNICNRRVARVESNTPMPKERLLRKVTSEIKYICIEQNRKYLQYRLFSNDY